MTPAVVDTTDLRRVGGLMLAAAAVLPALPGHPGLPCPLRTVTGIPCPLCGETTSVENPVHLNLGSAGAAAPAGILLVVFAVWLLVRRPKKLTIPMPLIIGALALMWVFQLHRFGYL